MSPFDEQFKKILEADSVELLTQVVSKKPQFCGVFFLELLKLNLKIIPEKCLYYLSNLVAENFPGSISQGIFLFTISSPAPYFKYAFIAQKNKNPNDGGHLLLRSAFNQWKDKEYQKVLKEIAPLVTLQELALAFPEAHTHHQKKLMGWIISAQTQAKLEKFKEETINPSFYPLIEKELILRSKSYLDVQLDPASSKIGIKDRL